MAFFEQRFDARLSYGARGGPAWKTTKVITESGRRNVVKRWPYPLHRYDVSHAIKTRDDFEIVRAFFYVVAGSFDGFRFKDWSDYQLTHNNSSLVQSVSSPGEWQIVRNYTVGSRTFQRPITKVAIPPPTHVRRTRSGHPSQVTATVDPNTGVVQFAGHQAGDTYTLTGQFDVPVSFTDDAMQAMIVDSHADGEFLLEWPNIVLEEIRV
jgi:uncharacterized protein (TIGR02217 family)